MPNKELRRLEEVNRYLNLHISKGQQLQQIVEQVASIYDAPIAMITFMGEDAQYIRFSKGTDIKQVDYHNTFCKHTIQQHDMLLVADASKDPRFSNNIYVVNDPHIRYYAGAPLITTDGVQMGTLCVFDLKPKETTELQRKILESLSRQVMYMLESESALSLLKEKYNDSKNTENKLRSFFESSSACHLLLDNDLRVTAFNKTMEEQILKNTGKELTEGCKMTDYLHPSFLKKFVMHYNSALCGQIISLEQELMYSHGRISWGMTFEPTYDLDGLISGVCFNAVDNTERMKQEERIREQRLAFNKINNIQDNELKNPVDDIIHLMNDIKMNFNIEGIQELQHLTSAVKELNEKAEKLLRQ